MESRPSFRAMTAVEYASLEEDGLRHELQAGWLLSEPRPFPRHGQIQVRVARALAEFVERHDLGVVLTGCGFLLSRNPDTVRGPDVAFVRRERYDPERAEREFFPGAPDLAVEILSPSNRPGEVHAKVADYLAAGSLLVWVPQPRGRGDLPLPAGAAPGGGGRRPRRRGRVAGLFCGGVGASGSMICGV